VKEQARLKRRTDQRAQREEKQKWKQISVPEEYKKNGRRCRGRPIRPSAFSWYDAPKKVQKYREPCGRAAQAFSRDALDERAEAS
jgi:hypothetical protein